MLKYNAKKKSKQEQRDTKSSLQFNKSYKSNDIENF